MNGLRYHVISYRDQPVYVTLFLLPVSPDAGHGLVIVGWVPVRVEHDQPIGANQIEAAAASLTAQHEHVVATLQGEDMNS